MAALAQPESGLMDTLASLEAEGFAGLPPEMREVFLKRACVGYSPALGALL